MKDGYGLFARPGSLCPDREKEALNGNKGDKPKAFCSAASHSHRKYMISLLK
jgi:hypothetical protein